MLLCPFAQPGCWLAMAADAIWLRRGGQRSESARGSRTSERGERERCLRHRQLSVDIETSQTRNDGRRRTHTHTLTHALTHTHSLTQSWQWPTAENEGHSGPNGVTAGGRGTLVRGSVANANEAKR